jgi:hypothetical protein
MSETGTARGPNWLGFGAATLMLLFICFAALIGEMLGGGQAEVPIIVTALGYAVIAALVERKRRNAGATMLLLSPFVFMATAAAYQTLRGG